MCVGQLVHVQASKTTDGSDPMKPYNRQAYQLFHDGILAFARAEQQGMQIDSAYCLEKRKELSEQIDVLERDFKNTKFYRHWEKSIGGKTPNIDSNAQLAAFLYKVKKIEPSKTTDTGKGATDEEALSQLGIPEVEKLLEYRKLKKLRDVYLDGFIREQHDGCLHPFFNLHTVKTFRSSSDRINFQNIPKRDKLGMELTRGAIYPRPGHQLIEADYSGIEVRISTCYHEDPRMIQYIKDPTTDMHGDMASQIFRLDHLDKSIPSHKMLRGAAKNGFVFPQFYGDYYKNCADNLACRWCGLPKGPWKKGMGIEMVDGTIADHLIKKGLKSYDAFENHLQKIEDDFWNNRFKVYSKWKEKWWENYQRKGYIETYTGFRCSGVMRRNECINIPIQGSAFHCLLWSFIEIDRISREHNWDTRLIGQIHDAMVLDVNPAELDMVAKTLHYVMCEALPKHWPWIKVPLEVEAEICDVDCSWNEKHDYHFPKEKLNDGIADEY